jgi:alanine racemase
MVRMYRKTYVEVDENILSSNIKEITNKYDYKYYIGVVKNNAYHHGIRIVNSLIESGINYLAVSSLEEAIQIRKYNLQIPILVLEPVSLEFIDDVINNHITLTIESLDYLKKLNSMSLPYCINMHLKIDTGMNRLGFKNKAEINEAVEIIRKNSKFFLEGIYTHLATSGISDYHYDKQISKFLELMKDIPLKEIPIVHIDRSLTFVSHEKLPFVTGVRLGIVMFGFSGSRKVGTDLKSKLREVKRQMYLKKHHISPSILENDLQLSTAYKLYSIVSSIRKVSKGEFVGYNAGYKVKEDGFIATIPVGYADGVNKDFGFVAINNKRYKIVADAMDMIMVLVDKNVKIDDKVEIFGDTIKIREVANKLGINAYHLFNQISTRVPIVHKKDNEKIEIKY